MTNAMSLDNARRHAQDTVKRSKTSFGAGMRILPTDRRQAMYAVYAFCREVDDIADEGGEKTQKKEALEAWRREIDRVYQGRPQYPTGVALLEHIERFGLPKREFIMMIAGMEMDANGPITAPSMDGLLAYTRRVAGAVGMLSMPIFGAPSNKIADHFALSLGDALQLTNILRDVEEDAEEGRLYLPYELLKKHGCVIDAATISNDPGLPAVRKELAEIAASRFEETRKALKDLDWRVLRPALLMMGVYETYLARMVARGWENGQPRIKISKLEKAAIAARWYFAPRLNRS